MDVERSEAIIMERVDLNRDGMDMWNLYGQISDIQKYEVNLMAIVA